MAEAELRQQKAEHAARLVFSFGSNFLLIRESKTLGQINVFDYSNNYNELNQENPYVLEGKRKSGNGKGSNDLDNLVGEPKRESLYDVRLDVLHALEKLVAVDDFAGFGRNALAVPVKA
jgi:hypothetical protein